MRLGGLLPSAYVGNEGPRAHHIVETGARLLQRAADVLQRLHRLRVHVTFAADLTVSTGRDRSRNRHERTHLHRAREADDRLVGRIARDILAFHVAPLSKHGIVPQAGSSTYLHGSFRTLAANALYC